MSTSITLPENKAIDLLKEYGLPALDYEILEEKEGDCSLSRLNYPVVAKVISDQISHKSDVGGVSVNIKDQSALNDAIKKMRSSIAGHMPDAEINGWLVTPMIKEGVEIILGGLVDPVFGRIVMVGIGGIFAELVKDVSFRAAPLSLKDAKAMIEELKLNGILKGFRHIQPVDLDKLGELIVKFSKMLTDQPGIVECDLNPVKCNEDTFSALDVRIVKEG